MQQSDDLNKVRSTHQTGDTSEWEQSLLPFPKVEATARRLPGGLARDTNHLLLPVHSRTSACVAVD